MALTISFTYDVVTPESADHGDVADHGFCDERGNRFSLNETAIEQETKDEPELYWVPVKPGDVASAIRFAKAHGCTQDNGDGSFYSEDSDINYQTGAETNYAVHFNGDISPGSMGRIAKAIGC